MAELSYGDIQHAVQDAIRNLQSNVQRLSSNVVNVSARADKIETLDLSIRDLQRTILSLQTSLMTTAKQSTARDPRVTQLIHDVYELKVRFTAIERFAQQMGEYVQSKEAAVREDNEYRNA